MAADDDTSMERYVRGDGVGTVLGEGAIKSESIFCMLIFNNKMRVNNRHC